MTDTTDRVVHSKQLAALLKDADQKKTRMQSISGEIGNRIREASDNGHLHKGVFGLMLKLYRMDELKRDEWLRLIPLYADMCREEGLFGDEHTGDLFDGRGGDDDDANDHDDEDAGDHDDDEGMASSHGDGLTGDVLAAHFPDDDGKPVGLPGADADGGYTLKH